jgi:RES domain-containing protein
LRFRGRCFRGHDPGWSFTPSSGEGARLKGGRFNRPGKPALYLSTAYDTAIGECTQGLANRIPPLTLCEYDVDCDPIADLSTEAARAALWVTLEDLACPWLRLMEDGKPVPSWEVAERMEAEGFVGMLVPSFFPGAGADHVNLILFKWDDEPPTLVRVYDPANRLPKDRSSWE